VKHTTTLLKRELGGYFATPVAYVFIVIFLLLASFFTFQLGQLYDRGQADLVSFFQFHPWLYLFLIPAIAMRLWAEERRSGSIELLYSPQNPPSCCSGTSPVIEANANRNVQPATTE